MIACTVLGHRWRFRAEGRTVRWSCQRCAAQGGERTYGSEADAQRYARGLDREDRDDLGRRTPLGLLPLRLLRRARAPRR